MKNEFMTSTKKAVVQLHNLQHTHARIKEHADARLRVAQDRQALDLSTIGWWVARGSNPEPTD